MKKQRSNPRSVEWGETPAQRLAMYSILIAVAPTVMYLLTYFFELGHAKFYGYPPALISISLETMLNTVSRIGLLILVLVAASALYAFIISFSRTLAPALSRRILIGMGIATIVGFGAGIGSALYLEPWISTTAVIILGIVGVILIPKLSRRLHRIRAKHKSTLVSSRRAGQKDVQQIPKTLQLAAFAMVTATTLVAARYLGEIEARYTHNYYVIESSPESLVLRIYGDIAITTPFNRQTCEISPQIVIRRLAEAAPVVMRLEDLMAAPKKRKQMTEPTGENKRDNTER